LQREQLPVWFDAVRKINNPVISAYLQALLLTGARREELMGLRWGDIDFKWKSITIRDKVEGQRTIPLTPYVASLLQDLKRRNQMPPTVRHLRSMEQRGEKFKPSPWVFFSRTSADGKLVEPRLAHMQALEIAGLPHLTIHGLRRSFGTLCEWVEVPTGISAQIMGHKPSALAEKHYRRRPIDLLRMWHEKIEAWILEQAGIEFKSDAEKPTLHAVKSS
jgi:integrase